MQDLVERPEGKMWTTVCPEKNNINMKKFRADCRIVHHIIAFTAKSCSIF
jgi:hypothetical protein